MTDDRYFDLVVIGGGPAGSTAATLVAMQGHRVLLLERERFPRYQIGESLLPPTIHAICAMLGVLDEVKAAGFVPKLGGVLRWGRKDEPWSFTFGDTAVLDEAGARYAYQVERARFDHILLRNARRRGVEVLEAHAVSDLIVEDERVRGVRYVDPAGRPHAARAAFVLDASGHAGTAHRHVGERVYSEFFRNVALFCYFDGAGRLEGPLAGSIISAAFRDGWFWFIPLSDRLTSVGAVLARDRAERLSGDREALMAELIAACPLIRGLLATATRVTEGPYGQFRVRSDYSYLNSRFWRPGLALVGDAACFVDPVFSTGVHLATYSALLAARSVNTALAGGVDEARCFREFEHRYRAEYQNIYTFLLGFYDLHHDESSYFWQARKILDTEERGNEAFVRLIAGMSTMEASVFDVGRAVSAHLKEFEAGSDKGELRQVARLASTDAKELYAYIAAGAHRPPETPRFAGGLVPAPDGFHWAVP